MHFLLTVLVEPEHASTESQQHARVDELMEPYGDLFEVPPYEADCWEDEHDDSCCNGSLTMRTTINPHPTRDWYRFVGGGQSRFEHWKFDELPSFALLIPDEGWSDQDSFYGRVVDVEDAVQWNAAFRAKVQSYTEQGFVPVHVDCHM